MKKTILFPLLMLLSFPIFSQEFQIKQITSGDFDARNPAMVRGPFIDPNGIFFEMHTDSGSNIVFAKYMRGPDEFEAPILITSDNSFNINPAAVPDYIFFQTNKNGNWDIAYRKFVNNTWHEIEYLVNSLENETNPVALLYSEPYMAFNQNILFQKGDTIFVALNENNSFVIEPVFINSAEFSYAEYSGIIFSAWNSSMPQTGYHFVAVQSENNNKRLVSRYRTVNGEWDSLNIIIDSCNCSNPTFQIDEYWPISLIFEDSSNGNIRLFQVMNWTTDKSIFPVEINYSGNTYSYKSDMPYTVTLGRESFQNYRFPHSYFVEENNNKRIRLSLDNFWPNWEIGDTLVSVKFPLSKLSVSNLGASFGTETVYTVWEDSADGKIQLFSRNVFILYSSVEDETVPDDFIVHQNYPNPFNPTTTIEYKIVSGSDVRFEVINILGEKILEENYGYQQAGNYKINFNGANIPSGIYIYSLLVGEKRLSRKMVLLR